MNVARDLTQQFCSDEISWLEINIISGYTSCVSTARDLELFGDRLQDYFQNFVPVNLFVKSDSGTTETVLWVRDGQTRTLLDVHSLLQAFSEIGDSPTFSFCQSIRFL